MKSARILYVEDSITQSKLMLAILANKGMLADCFATAEEALIAIEKNNYDLLLTDINLGAGMSGLDLARHLRGMNGIGKDIPIVAITASDDAALRTELFAIGIDDYVTKPALPEELFVRIRRLIDRHHLISELAAHQTQLETTIEKRTKALLDAQIQLQESEFRWKFAIEGSGAGLWDWDVAKGTVFFSKRWKEMIGYAEDELSDSQAEWETRIHPHDKAEVLAHVQACLDGETSAYANEHRFRCKDGEYIWIFDRGMVVSRGADGKPLRLIGTHSDISARKQAEFKLKDNEFAARLAAENAHRALEQLQLQKYALDQHAIVATTDLRGKITYVNDKLCEISGYAREELIGQDHVLLNSGEHPHGFFKTMYASITHGEVWHGEVCNRAKDGHLYWMQTTIVPFLRKDGKPEQYIAIRADISARKLAELELRKSAEFIRKIAALAPGCLYQFKLRSDGSFCVPYASPGLSAIYGIAPDEVLEDATRIFSAVHPEDADGFRRSIEQSALNCSDWRYDYRVNLEDGLVRWISGHAIPQREEDGAVLWHGYLSDITTQKQAELRLIENERSLRETQRIARIGWYVTDIASSVWTSSTTLDEIFGIDQSYAKTIATWGNLLAPEFAQQQADHYRHCVETRTRFRAQYQIIRPIDGQRVWIDAYGDFVFDDDGNPITLMGAIQDISERKAIELELQDYRDHLEDLVQQKTADLQQSQAHLNTIFSTLNDFVWLKNREGVYLRGNRMFQRLFGKSEVDLVGKTDFDFFEHELAESFRHHDQLAIAAGVPTVNEEWVTLADGGQRVLLETVKTPVVDASGQLAGVLGIARDITKRKAAEAAAHAANRAKSEFLANMSHEIRTPMNGVIGMVDILQETDLKPAQRRMLDTIHNSSLALLNILNDILDYSKIEAGKLSIEFIPTHLRDVAEGVAVLISTSANAKAVAISVFVSPELPTWIVTDPTRLRQMLLNLLGNAVKFSGSRTGNPGRVTLCVEPCVLADNRAGVQLRVNDNGIGMSPEILANLFQPFTQADASTARKFGGTGLGLSICQRLIELMGGQISVRSTLGHGAEFTIELPLIESAPGRPLEAEPSLAGVRVLVMSRDAFAMQYLPVYCAAVGAKATLLPDLAAICQELRQTPAVASTVVVLDHTTTTELDLPAGVGIVRTVARNTSSPVAGITVTARPMLYRELIHGLALASGRLTLAAVVAPANRQAEVRKVAPSVEQAVANGQLILLAEDNETNREVMQEQLLLLGYACELAEDGVVALHMWLSGRYALLLTDCNMPNMDGFELTSVIRHAEHDGARLPIIAVTANAMQGEAQRCYERGMDDYLSKPLRLDELGPMLAKWMPLPVVSEDVSDVVSDKVPDAVPPAPTFANCIWDATVLPGLVGNNPAMHKRLLEKFLLSAGDQVGAMTAAIKAGDTGLVAKLAHKLKSAARTVGALQVGELCEALETAGNSGDIASCRAQVAGLEVAFAAAALVIENALAAPPCNEL